ncbi:MAG TPA: hypothetical protein VF989_20430 [Polyangiaceae bacterium]|jgi:hypothetical protein
MPRTSRAVPLLAAVVLVARHEPAAADEAERASVPHPEARVNWVDDTKDEPPATPEPARDTLMHHVIVAASAAPAWPWGSIQQNLGYGDVAGSGTAFGADLGLGVSRAAAIGIWGQLVLFSDEEGCPCSNATSFAVGPWVRYHLVQGVRLDPWLSLGLGYRRFSFDLAGEDQSYQGFDWLRVQLGGDWYAAPQLGIGPFLELDLGTYTSRPDDTSQGSVYAQGLVGVRVALDLPGK